MTVLAGRAAVPVQAKYFHANSSTGLLEADVQGHALNVRTWWRDDASGSAIIFPRIGLYPNAYLYVPIHWDTRTILVPKFGTTDRDARRTMIADLRLTGWSLPGDPAPTYFHAHSSAGYMESDV